MHHTVMPLCKIQRKHSKWTTHSECTTPLVWSAGSTGVASTKLQCSAYLIVLHIKLQETWEQCKQLQRIQQSKTRPVWRYWVAVSAGKLQNRTDLVPWRQKVNCSWVIECKSAQNCSGWGGPTAIIGWEMQTNSQVWLCGHEMQTNSQVWLCGHEMQTSSQVWLCGHEMQTSSQVR